MRRYILAGNWKMHKDQNEAVELVNELAAAVKGNDGVDIVVGPVFTSIASVVEAAKGTNIDVAAQNCHWEPSGAYTGEIALAEFGRQEGVLRFLSRAPQKTRERWERFGVMPRGIDREVVTTLHSTHIGASNEARHLIHACVRTGLADGWGGSMIATELSDILVGGPEPLLA